MTARYGGHTREEVAAAVMDERGTIRHTTWSLLARQSEAASRREVLALARFLRRKPIGEPRAYSARLPLPEQWRLPGEDATPHPCVVVELDTEPRGLLPRIRNRRTTDTGGPRT